VQESERERERKGTEEEKNDIGKTDRGVASVCVCKREKERERERKGDIRKTDRGVSYEKEKQGMKI